MHPKTALATVAVAAAAAAGGAVAFDALSPSTTPSKSSAASSAQTGIAKSVSDNTTARTVYDGAKNSVAYIAVATQQGQGAGSGFVVSDDGLIVTNEHVVDGATQIGVKLGTDGKLQSAQVIATDPSHDLALIKVDQTGLTPLKLADGANVGDNVFAVGSPFGLDQTLTTGIVSALNRDIQAPDGSTITGAIQTDAAINPGNSGGPLLDEDGQVIGVNSQIASQSGGSTGVGFAISADTVKQFLDAAKNGQGSAQQEQQQAPQQQVPQQQVDPYGQEQQQVDPYGGQADPYGGSPYEEPQQQDAIPFGAGA